MRAHENGSVEKSHDLFKKTVGQQLMLRGSRDFTTIEEYNIFLEKIKCWRNHGRENKMAEEYKILKNLPENRWNAPKIISARVSPSSTIQVLGSTYSVPSRLISLSLRVYIYPREVQLYYGDKCILTMQKIPPHSVNINYRHIVGHLLRKPGAFAHYQYREHLYPRLIFRQACDALVSALPVQGHKHYLEVLHFAAITNESEVAAALELLLESKQLPNIKTVKELIESGDSPVPVVKVNQINLKEYDQLIKCTEVADAIMH